MRRHVYHAWAKLFARPLFQKLNETAINIGLRGLGVLNYESDTISGESWLVRQFLKSLFKDLSRPIFFDVGANEGTYTKLLRETFPEASIHAFEAHPRTYERLVAATKELAVNAVGSAIGSESGDIQLFDYADDSLGSQHASVIPLVLEKVHGARQRSYEVPIMTIDAYCERNRIDRVDFLKLDIEGNEYAALRGAREMLKREKINVIQFEFNEMNVLARLNMQDFCSLLETHKLFRLLPSGLLRLDPGNLFQSNLFAFQNIIALPSSPVVYSAASGDIR